MTRSAPTIAIDFIKRAEACRLTAYLDSAGVWTIGYGHTGPEVKRGLKITQAQADAYLRDDLNSAARQLARKVDERILLRLTAHQYAALLSFVFNLGIGNWTIWKVLNAGEFDQVPRQILRFDKAKVNGVLTTLPGLAHRRAAEKALWETPDLEAAVTIAKASYAPAPSSGAVRAMETPPEPEPAKPLAKPSLWAKVASLIAGGGVAAKQVVDIVQPHADVSPIFQQVVVVCTGVIIVAGVVALWIGHEQEKARHQ